MTGRSAAKRDARRSAKAQEKSLLAQQRKEDIRLGEATDEIQRRKLAAASRSKGRQSLIKTSPTGLATNLGGTASV